MRGKKSSNFILFLCFSALFISAPAFATPQAGEKTNYPVHFISVAPEIDGRLDEPVWQSLPEATGFYVLGGEVAKAKQTFFRMGWDKDNLYIGIKCEEPDIAEVIEDSVEIFLASALAKYSKFMVNTMGSRLSYQFVRVLTRGPKIPLSNWEGDIYKGEDYWSVEIRIPFAILGFDRGLQDGEIWKGNITRNITVFTSGGNRSTTWAPLKRSFHELHNFASFLFKQKELPVKEVKKKRVAPPVIWKEVSPPVFSRYPGGTFAKGKLTSASGPHAAPRLSSCGKKVLFNSTRGGRIGVWLVDSKGEKEKRICDGDQGQWSPDGKRIIFRREGRIVERILASGEERVMSPSDWRDCSFPSYSPDGKKILFVADMEGEKGIFVMELGEKPSRLLKLLQRDVQCAPRWSPNGKRIAFQDRGSIDVVDIDGVNRRRLTTAGGIQSSPVWSLYGRGVAYCQASDPNGLWDLYIIGVDDGRAPRLRMRNLDLGPDWQVEYFGEQLPLQMGSHLHLWEVKTHIDNESIKKRTGWKTLSPDKAGSILNIKKRSIAVENDWLIFFLSRKRVFIFFKGEQKRIEFIPFDRKGKKARRIQSLRILKNGSEEVVIEVSYFSGPKLAYRIPRTRPFIEVTPLEDAGKVYLRADMYFLLLPDRFANDLIFAPAKYFPSRFPLPSTDLLIGLLGQGNSLMMIIAPSNKQRAELIKKQDIFTGTEISFEQKSFFVSILSGEGIWHQEQSGEDSLIFSPKTPFPGIYRLALYSSRRYCTRIFSGGTKVSIDEELGKPELALVYLYGRTRLTPINILTPIDIIKEIWEKPLGEMLETEGLTTYHIPGKGPDPGPRKTRPKATSYVLGVPENLTKHRPLKDWTEHPHISLLIESLRNMFKHPHGKKYTGYLCGVIEKFIEKMDRRLDEYRNFTGQIDSLSKDIERRSAKSGGFLEEMERIKKELNDLEERGLNLKPKKEITEHCERIRAKRANHLSFNVLFDAIAERRELLREYKRLVMNLRDSAGMAIAREPAIRKPAEEIRNLTQVIGRRDFVEKKKMLVIIPNWPGDQGRRSHVVTLLLE